MGNSHGGIAAITGAGNGIGAACAERLAQEGMHLVLFDLEAPAVEAVAEAIRTTGGQAEAHALDCTDRVAIEDSFARVARDTGGIDVLVNNVGQSARERMSAFAEADMDVLDMILDINLKSTVVCARQVVPGMKARGYGRIVNMASESAVNGSLKTWDYSAAKAGVIGFTRSVARELAAHGITVNAVGPGATATRAMERVPADLIEAIKEGIPAGRMGDPREIANVVAFFAGDQASYVTGQTLLVNGGNWML